MQQILLCSSYLIEIKIVTVVISHHITLQSAEMSVAAATREAFKMLLKVILLSSSWKVSVCNILLIILGFLTITASAYSVDNNPYRHKETLDRRGKYELEWLVEMEQKRITFNVTVQTKGYVGLGLSRRGKMAGADLVIGGVNHDGEPYFYVKKSYESHNFSY